MPCLMQPRRLSVFASRAHYCMLVNLFTGASRFFSPKLLSSQSAPVCAGVWDSPSRGAQALHFPLLNIIIESCFAISPICQDPSESTTWCTNHSSQFSIIYILSEGALWLFIQVIHDNIKQFWSHYAPQASHHWGLASIWTSCCWSQPCESGNSNSCQSTSLI